MTSIDGGIAPRLEGSQTAFDSPLSDLLVTLGAEFFVEWQVPDQPTALPSGGWENRILFE